MKITEPGVYDLPEADYHADPCVEPSLSSGVAKVLLDRSPWHARIQHPRLNPAYEAENGKQFDLGRAAHSLILGDPKQFAYIEADNYTTKAAREQRDAAYEASKIPLLPGQAATLDAMNDAFWPQLARMEPLAAAWEVGRSEQSMIWHDHGVWCRARADRLCRGPNIIFDYKSIKNAAPENCVRQVFKMGWDVQNGFYRRGANDLARAHEFRFIFLFQETESPHALTAVEFDPKALAYADDRALKAIEHWGQCVDADEWPGYPERICYAELPTWTDKRWAEEQLREEIEE